MNDPSMQQFFQQTFAGTWITQGLAVAAELGLADQLADGPKTPDELAEHTHTNRDALHRLLRALASVGVFSADAAGRYSLTPLAELLRSNVAGSQRGLAAMMGGEFYEAWGALLHSVRTGEPGFQKRFDQSFFRYMLEHPDRHSLYDRAMTGVHGRETEPMLDAYAFAGIDTVIDVGGGNGMVLAAILRRYAALKGVLFELPAVANRAQPNLSEWVVTGRCRIECGDFLTSVPLGADVYLLRHIIHDWQDTEAVAILRQCVKAMRPDGKVLVVETVLPPGNEPSFGKWLDLMMLLVAGRERTLDEYERLFAAAGLRVNRVVPTTAEVSILEGLRAV